MKFKIIKDLINNNGFDDEVILKEGETIEPNEEGVYFFKIINRFYTKEQLLTKPNIFKPLIELELDIKEIDQDEEDKIGNWRIQLDVKTSKRKLKEIEKIVKEVIRDIL